MLSLRNRSVAEQSGPILYSLPMSSFVVTQRKSRRLNQAQKKADNRKELANMMENYRLKVGFKIHVQMLTEHKLFSTALNTSSGEPNSHANFVDLALPGMLPVLNENCLNSAVRACIGFGGRIMPKIKFERKHYYYHDSPQGYQITQNHDPVMRDGRIFYYDRFDTIKSLQIKRVKLEQDTAKSIPERDHVLIDYNRCGAPLLEITSSSDIDHPEDGKLSIREIQSMMQGLKISEARTDHGEMRIDINVSIYNENYQSPRVTVKQVIGTKNVERAIEHEYRRQVMLVQNGERCESEMRRFDPENNTSERLRLRDTEPDYRYFIDPDLPAVQITNDRISEQHQAMEEIPFEAKKRFASQYGMDISDVKAIFKNPWSVDIFQRIVWQLQTDSHIVWRLLYQTIYESTITHHKDFQIVLVQKFGHNKLIDLITMAMNSQLDQTQIEDVVDAIVMGKSGTPKQIAGELGFLTVQLVTDFVKDSVDEVFENHEDLVAKALITDKSSGVMNLVDRVMKRIDRKGDPVVIKHLVQEKLAKIQQTSQIDQQ